MLNVVVALKIWANTWQNTAITLFCDNLAVVEVLNQGRTKDEFLATCARNIWLLSSLFNIHIQIIHIPGKRNQVADLLSRWTMLHKPHQKLNTLLCDPVWMPAHPDLTCLNVFI